MINSTSKLDGKSTRDVKLPVHIESSLEISRESLETLGYHLSMNVTFLPGEIGVSPEARNL